MPTPDLIAATNPIAAARSSALLGSADASAPVGSVSPGFAALLTALQPKAMPAGDIQQGLGQNLPQTCLDLLPATPKSPMSKAETGHQLKSPVIQKLRTFTLESELPQLDQPLQASAAVIPPPIQGTQLPSVDVGPTGEPAEARPIAVSRKASSNSAELVLSGPVSDPSSAIGTSPNEHSPVARPPDPPATVSSMIQATPHQASAILVSSGVVSPALAKLPPAGAVETPVEQMVPVLVSVARIPSGALNMTLRLQPDALGELHIAIERAPDAATHVRISVDRPETLELLQRETPQLQRALDLAGVTRGAMTVTLHAAPGVTLVPQAHDAAQTSQQFFGTGQHQQGFGDGRPKPAQYPNSSPENEPVSAAATTVLQYKSAKSGIDITA